MPHARPPHLHRETTRHGNVVWYHRVEAGKRTRIRGEYGGAEFWAAYEAAEGGRPVVTAEAGAACGTLAWLIAQYRTHAPEWIAPPPIGLSQATKRKREQFFRQATASAGHVAFARIDEAAILAGRDRRSTTPFQARHYMDAMRALFRWAKETKYIAVDPSASVKNLPRPKTQGHVPWSEEWMARYDAAYPLGSKERVWRDVIAYTGLRRSDAVRVGRQHERRVKGIRCIVIKTQKTGREVTLPILPVLAATLAAGPIGELTWVVGATGRPIKAGTLGNYFEKACAAVGIPGRAHGIRKCAAMRAALNGATEDQLNALFGWEPGSGMAALYTAAANRVRLAMGSIDKLLGELPDAGNEERTAKIFPLTLGEGAGKNAKNR